ncbi:Major Facilitator Superfamily protein [Apiospora arundinis]|uniref:Major Facilitator Superfamily protein n=1 Tax=Apiospora arundinis TaxID=335852 RepID=A0ABR2HYH9_9PEZI
MHLDTGSSSCCEGQSQTPSSPKALEKARLRRNQRNSRARKQAYIRDLENRWNECVRLGAQATVEMQREARRVQEENHVLRQLLQSRGMEHEAIQTAVSSMTVKTAPGELDLVSQSNGSAPHTTGSHCPEPRGASFDGAAPRVDPSFPDSDPAQSLNLSDWLEDLCDIKNAFEFEAYTPQNRTGL